MDICNGLPSCYYSVMNVRLEVESIINENMADP